MAVEETSEDTSEAGIAVEEFVQVQVDFAKLTSHLTSIRSTARQQKSQTKALQSQLANLKTEQAQQQELIGQV